MQGSCGPYATQGGLWAGSAEKAFGGTASAPAPCGVARSVVAACLNAVLMPDDATGEALLAAIKRNAEKSEESARNNAVGAALNYAQAARELADALNAAGLKLCA